MITLAVLLTLVTPLSPPTPEPLPPPPIVIEAPAPVPIPEPTPPVTWQDNPQKCDEAVQWIAAEPPFNCIPKAVAPVATVALVGSSAGNTYTYLSCTWHVKQMRPDIPNNWGNATNWLYNAQAIGWPTGSEARVGAIGWTYGHVVYILKAEGDRVYLSERNYDWNGSYRERWASASSMQYIY